MCADVPDRYGNVRVWSSEAFILPCHVTPSATTNVKWLQTDIFDIFQHDPPLVYDIYINGSIVYALALEQRFSISDATAGDYSLTIVNVKVVDIGIYRCFNGEQLIETYDVDVKSKY